MSQHEQHQKMDNGSKDPEQRAERLRAEIAETRERVAQDVGALGEKFSAAHVRGGTREMMRRNVDRASSTARRAGSSMSHYVQDHPVQVAAVAAGAVGAGWLIASRLRSRHERSYTEQHHEPELLHDETQLTEPFPREAYAHSEPDPHQEGLSSASGSTPEAPSHTRERLRETSHKARHRAGEIAERMKHMRYEARDRAARAGHRSRERLSSLSKRTAKAREGASHVMEENPLLIGAAAFAAGLGMGLLLPVGQKERKVFGPARERVVEKAREKLHSAREVAGHAVEEAKRTVKKGAKEHGREGAERSEEATRVAGEAMSAARRTAEEEARERKLF